MSSSPPTLTMTWRVPALLLARVRSQQTLLLLSGSRWYSRASSTRPRHSGLSDTAGVRSTTSWMK